MALPFLFWKSDRPLAGYCLYFLMFSIPYRIMFGGSLGYRFLMFVPFFAILASMVLNRKQLVLMLALLILVNIVFCIDPIHVSAGMYVLGGEETFFEALFRGFR